MVWLDRPVPLYERVALYSVADCALVTCVRDGMNLVPYEYTVCRQGVQVRDYDRLQRVFSSLLKHRAQRTTFRMSSNHGLVSAAILMSLRQSTPWPTAPW